MKCISSNDPTLERLHPKLHHKSVLLSQKLCRVDLMTSCRDDAFVFAFIDSGSDIPRKKRGHPAQHKNKLRLPVSALLPLSRQQGQRKRQLCFSHLACQLLIQNFCKPHHRCGRQPEAKLRPEVVDWRIRAVPQHITFKFKFGRARQS